MMLMERVQIAQTMPLNAASSLFPEQTPLPSRGEVEECHGPQCQTLLRSIITAIPLFTMPTDRSLPCVDQWAKERPLLYRPQTVVL